MLLGALTAVQLVDAGKKAWSGCKGAKALIHTVQKYRRAPEEMRFTFQLAGCVVESLSVAEALATRHMSLRIVGSPVLLARAAVQQCEALFVEATVTDTEAGWAEWMRTGQKFEALQQAQARLALAMNALQLALSAVSASTLPPRFAISPFAYVPDAFEIAHHQLQQIQMGRTHSILLAGGELWQRGLSRSTSGRAGASQNDAMRLLFSSCVRLHRGSRRAWDEDNEEEEDDDDDDDDEAAGAQAKPAAGAQGRRAAAPAAAAANRTPDTDGSESLVLWFVARGDAADDGDEGDTERVVPLDDTVKLRRWWSQELAAELSGSHGSDFLEIVGRDVLCYQLTPSAVAKPPPTGGTTHPLILTFQLEANDYGGGRLSAESFEALVFLALSACRAAPSNSARGARSAAQAASTAGTTYDPAKPAPLVAAINAHVGPLQGAPGSPESAERDPMGGLMTPMRGLGIS